jgi:hypothetical protein
MQHKNENYSVVLYGRETLSLALRAFENMLQSGIFNPETEEVTRDWTGLYNTELHKR